jgi:hypothetical protein
MGNLKGRLRLRHAKVTKVKRQYAVFSNWFAIGLIAFVVFVVLLAVGIFWVLWASSPKGDSIPKDVYLAYKAKHGGKIPVDVYKALKAKYVKCRK